jgi:hypothetical protein
MRDAMVFMICLLAAAQGTVKRFAGTRQSISTPAVIEGQLTVTEVESRQVADKPLGKLTVYLLDLEQSRPLQELQHKCHMATANQNLDPTSAYNICEQSLADAVKLVPTLASAASTQTDVGGAYIFENVSPARQYQVVSVKVEDDEPVVIVGLTPRLKPGEHVRLNLRENDPWTNADPLGDAATTPRIYRSGSRKRGESSGGHFAKSSPPAH